MILNSGASPADTWLSDSSLPAPATSAAPAANQSALGLGDRMIVEQELTEGRFILGINSNLGSVLIPEEYQSTRVSLAKEGRGPQTCSHLEDCGAWLLFALRLRWAVGLHSSFTWRLVLGQEGLNLPLHVNLV